MLQWDAHDRQALQRRNEAWLERTWAEPSTEVLVVAGTRVRPQAGELRWVPSAEAPEGVRVLLGGTGERARFAVIVDPADAPGDRSEWVGLRALFMPLLDSAEADASAATGDAPWLFHAIGLAEWHWATRFCPRCGGQLQPRSAGHELVCVECGKPQFPRSDPAVIMAVTDGEPGSEAERILLGRNVNWPEDRWSTLAGFCEPGESLEEAVRREVAEEAGVRVGEVTYFGSQPWPLPASLMMGFTARATDPTITLLDPELADARWLTRRELLDERASGQIATPRSISISSSLLQSWLQQ